MYLYLRHAEKLYANGRKPHSGFANHDPPISDAGRQAALKLGPQLVERYGVPDRVLVSPYRRCRETVAALMANLDPNVPIIVVPRLGEYLGNWWGRVIELDPVTESFFPPQRETFKDLQRRVTKHYLINRERPNPGLTWVVTHGLVIEQLIALLDVPREDTNLRRGIPTPPGKIPYLGVTVVDYAHHVLPGDSAGNLDERRLQSHDNGEDPMS